MYIDVLLFKDRRKLKGRAPLPPIGAPDVEVAPQNLATPYEGFRRRAIKGIDKSEFITKQRTVWKLQKFTRIRIFKKCRLSKQHFYQSIDLT